MCPDPLSSTDGAGRSYELWLCDKYECGNHAEQAVGETCEVCNEGTIVVVKCVPESGLLAGRERTRVLEEALRRADALLLRFAEMDAFNVWSTYWKNEIAEVRESLAAVAEEDDEGAGAAPRAYDAEAFAEARKTPLMRRVGEIATEGMDDPGPVPAEPPHDQEDER